MFDLHFNDERFDIKTSFETEVKETNQTSSNLAASIPRTFSTSAVLLDVVAVPLTPKNKHNINNFHPIRRRYERRTNPVKLGLFCYVFSPLTRKRKLQAQGHDLLYRPFLSYLVPLFQNESYKKENEPVSGMTERVGGTNFHLNGSALRLVLTQRQKATQKVAYWTISRALCKSMN